MDQPSWWLSKNALIAADATFYTVDAVREYGRLTPQNQMPHQREAQAPVAPDKARDEMFGRGRRQVGRKVDMEDSAPFGRDVDGRRPRRHSYDEFGQRIGNNPKPQLMMPSWSDSPRVRESTGTSTRWRAGDDQAFTMNGDSVPGGRNVVGVNNSVWRTGEDLPIAEILAWKAPAPSGTGAKPVRRIHRPPVNLSSAWRNSEDLPLTIAPIQHMSPSSRMRVLSARKTPAELAAMRIDNSWRLGTNVPIQLEHMGEKLAPRTRIEGKPRPAQEVTRLFSDDLPWRLDGEFCEPEKRTPRFADKQWRIGQKNGVVLGDPLPYEGLYHAPAIIDETGVPIEKKGVRAQRMRRERDILIDRLQELQPLDDQEQAKRVSYLMRGEAKFR